MPALQTEEAATAMSEDGCPSDTLVRPRRREGASPVSRACRCEIHSSLHSPGTQAPVVIKMRIELTDRIEQVLDVLQPVVQPV